VSFRATGRGSEEWMYCGRRGAIGRRGEGGAFAGQAEVAHQETAGNPTGNFTSTVFSLAIDHLAKYCSLLMILLPPCAGRLPPRGDYATSRAIKLLRSVIILRYAPNNFHYSLYSYLPALLVYCFVRPCGARSATRSRPPRRAALSPLAPVAPSADCGPKTETTPNLRCAPNSSHCSVTSIR
jgi:hypothetical protein